LATVKQILRLYQQQYADFNVRHFHEKLREQYHILLGYTWVKQVLQTAGLVKKSRQRRAHRRRRPRRPLVGMLLQLDGVFLPRTSPRVLASGPPELPGLMGASVWIHVPGRRRGICPPR
jgi:hypothetical protein